MSPDRVMRTRSSLPLARPSRTASISVMPAGKRTRTRSGGLPVHDSFHPALSARRPRMPMPEDQTSTPSTYRKVSSIQTSHHSWRASAKTSRSRSSTI